MIKLMEAHMGNADVCTVHLLTTEEAVKLVKRSERFRAKFCLHVRIDALLATDAKRVFSDGCSSYLDISRADALHLASTLLCAALEARGGRIRICERVYKREDSPACTTYWIG